MTKEPLDERGPVLIELRGVTKRYSMGGAPVEVLSSVDLDIGRGEFVSIMGPSGSGKSTLMNIIGCLDRPTEGTYALGGVRVDSMDEDSLASARNRNIGFVFQSFNLLARHTAIENVELPLFYAGVEDSEKLAIEALKEVGLEKRMRHRPNELSGGERQRVAIARAIVLKPPIILGDEPTGNLDSRTGSEIMALFEGLHSRGTTLILVTHDPNIAAYSGRVINIKDGRVVSSSIFVFEPLAVTCGASLGEGGRIATGRPGSEATSGERFAGRGGGQQAEHVTESGGSSVTWYLCENILARRRAKELLMKRYLLRKKVISKINLGE